MKKISIMNNLLREILETPRNFMIFPFAMWGFVFIIAFYIACPFYMLVELFVDELKTILFVDGESASDGAQIVKNLIGFGVVVVFNFLRAMMVIPLAIGYFMTSVLFTLSSIGGIKNNPFGYSK